MGEGTAWGYARCATDLGVDIIQNCEATGFSINNGQVRTVHTSKGRIETDSVGLAVSGHSTHLAEIAGFRLPIETVPLQALVTEPLKPVLKCAVISASIHAYVSQSDKGAHHVLSSTTTAGLPNQRITLGATGKCKKYRK